MPLPPGLLPEGLRDRLPPEAEAQARTVRAMLDTIARHGYDRVSPPLAEFEEGLVGRLKSARAQDLLRFVDPVSQRTLALRPDITTQVGRIASTRMANAPRPLRLAYGGLVIKLRASQLRPEREMMQIGAELIGSDGVAAAREIVGVAVEALQATGVGEATVDLTMPDLVDVLASGPMPVAPDRRERLRTLLDSKDAGGLAAEGFLAWLPLVGSAGPLDRAIAQLRGMEGADAVASRLDGIATIAASLGTRVTLDPTERHGFEYQSWFGFSLFASGLAGEIGRGGSYTIVHPDGREEPATGFSLYPDALLDGSVERNPTRRMFLPLGSNPAAAARHRREGWRTVAALTESCDAAALGCTHRLDGDTPVALQE